VLTRFGGAAAAGAVAAVATSAGTDGSADGSVADVTAAETSADGSVADVTAAEGGLCGGVAAEVFGADTSRVTAIEFDGAEVADDAALKVVGG
jgi:hypothetical protein